MKNQSKLVQNRFWGRSWGQDGPKSQQVAKMSTKVTHLRAQDGSQNRSKIDLEAIQMVIFFWSFWGSTIGAIWCQLDSNLAPKTLPKWSQVGTKSMQVGVLIWQWFWKGSWHNFYRFFIITWHGRGHEFIGPADAKYTFLFFCCCAVGLTFS